MPPKGFDHIAYLGLSAKVNFHGLFHTNEVRSPGATLGPGYDVTALRLALREDWTHPPSC